MHSRTLAIALGLLVTAGVHAAGHEGGIAWERNPAAGLAKARSDNKGAMLYFTAAW